MPSTMTPRTKQIAAVVGLLGLIVSVAVGWQRDLGDGLIVATAWTISIGIWLIMRNPPPPNKSPGDGAGLDFGM